MSYTQLTTDLSTFMGKRADLPVSRLVALTESRLNRLLRVRQQESAITGTINASGEIALPADYAATKSLRTPGYRPLLAQSLEAVLSAGSSGLPTIYAVTGSAWVFDGTGSIEGVYYKRLPSLESSGSNWLSLAAYDVYLMGCLEEAYRYGQNEQQAMSHRARFLDGVAELQRADARDRSAGPLVSQAC